MAFESGIHADIMNLAQVAWPSTGCVLLPSKLIRGPMSQADLHRVEVRLQIGCNTCGGRMRLFGIEPHPIRDRVEIRSYVCIDCDALEIESVSVLPLL
jgi:hypothetical protein